LAWREQALYLLSYPSARDRSAKSMTPDLVPFAANLLERFARLGVDVDELLRRAEIARSRFSVARPLGTTAELFALWHCAEECGGGKDLGLRVGSETPAHHQNIASLAALHSPTLGEGLAKLARYKRLVCPEEITLDVHRGEARLRFEWMLADSDPPPRLIDCIFAGVVGLAQRGTGTPIRPLRLELTRRRAHEALLRRHFGCDIRFDAPFEVIVLEEALLALPLVTHNAHLLAVLLPGLESALEQAGGSRTLADDVRSALNQRICGERPAVDKVAKALGMSPRTLQRRLGELGTTYQQLLDEVRHRSARRLLANTDLGPGEVAFLLGFEELNSFTRAFHSWEGTTPARWRVAHASAPS
jgi:AraC-like DNA-binding protein